MSEQKDVTQDSSPEVSEDLKTQSQETDSSTVESETSETQPVGSQTPPEKLHAALKEEREENRRKEERIAELEDKLKYNETVTSTIPDDEMSDEGRQLQREVQETKQELAKLKDEKSMESLETKYPALKDKSSEFQEYRDNYPKGASIESVAKLFLSENDLLGEPAKRKGLEKATGGTKSSTSGKMTSKDVEELRKNNYTEYLRKLDSGELRTEDIT